MKKNLLPLLSLLLVLVLSSCEKEKCIRGTGEIATETRQTGSFSGIDLRTSGKVYVKQGPETEVKVEAYESVLPFIDTDVRGDLLVIEQDRCIRNSRGRINIYVTVPSISQLSVNGSGSIMTLETFVSNDLDLKINGSGKIDARTDATRLFSKISGSGDINVTGTAVQHTVSISGSGDVYSFGLSADNCDVSISGSGDASVQVVKNLDVKISGSGKVYYKGTANVNNVNISGSGKLVRQN